MPLKPGPAHVLDTRAVLEQLDDGGGTAGMRLHAQVQRAQAAVDEEAVERARHGADRVLDEAQPLVPLGVAGDHDASDDVRVAAQVLGGGVHDEVGAELQRALVGRRGERVVDRDQGVAPRRATTCSMSTTLSSGLVGLSTQISRVSSRTAVPSASRSVCPTRS